MPRYTSQGWWCHCTQKNSPDAKKCSKCGALRFEKNAQVHASERAVVYYNPVTGEHRTPARADTPIPQHYADAGFERREILSMTAYEKETGVVHEASNYAPGNEPTPEPRMPNPNPEAIRELAKDMADAIASGPWTGAENLLTSTQD